MTAETIPTMLGIKECSAQTGLSYDMLRKLCLQEKIVYVRSGKKFLINLNRLCDYQNGKQNDENAPEVD